MWLVIPLVIHNNFLNCMALHWWSFIQISTLSMLDGRIKAYHGFDGWQGIRLWFWRERRRNGYHIHRRQWCQITQSQHEEVRTINNNIRLFRSCNLNEYNLNLLTRNNWRPHSLKNVTAVLICMRKSIEINLCLVIFDFCRSLVVFAWSAKCNYMRSLGNGHQYTLQFPSQFTWYHCACDISYQIPSFSQQ